MRFVLTIQLLQIFNHWQKTGRPGRRVCVFGSCSRDHRSVTEPKIQELGFFADQQDLLLDSSVFIFHLYLRWVHGWPSACRVILCRVVFIRGRNVGKCKEILWIICQCCSLRQESICNISRVSENPSKKVTMVVSKISSRVWVWSSMGYWMHWLGHLLCSSSIFRCSQLHWILRRQRLCSQTTHESIQRVSSSIEEAFGWHDSLHVSWSRCSLLGNQPTSWSRHHDGLRDQPQDIISWKHLPTGFGSSSASNQRQLRRLCPSLWCDC